MNGHSVIRDKHDDQLVDGRANVRLWLRLLNCSTVIEKRLRRRLAERGTTLPRFDVMAALERHPEGLTMSGLSHWLLVSNGNVTGVVQSLVKEALVSMDPSPRDRRASIVRLTKRGQTVFAELSRAHREWIEAMFAELDAGQNEAMFGLLGVLRNSIAREVNNGETSLES